MDEWICYERHLFWNNLFQGFPYRQFFMYWHDANEHVCCLILWHASLVSGPAGTCNTLPKVQFTPQRLHLSHLVIAAVHVRRCWGGDMRELITSGSTDEVQAVYEAVEPQTWLGWPFFNESFWFSQKAWDSDYSEEPGRALRWAVFVEMASVHENVRAANRSRMEHSNPSCEMSLCLISLPLAPALRHGEKFMTLEDWRDLEATRRCRLSRTRAPLMQTFDSWDRKNISPRKAAKSDEYLRPLSGGQEDWQR